ncbi:hypothetical protein ACFW61_31745 [Streptomyces microflavus]|uniref:hypothetical protein n=1 Tax=Streptomyces microflavus TaxID=1919 RepID=UPI0036BA30D4
MTKVYFQVDVPTRNCAQPERCGLHVFTGAAETEADALRIAREACEAAVAARAAGAAIPRRRPDGWGGARGSFRLGVRLGGRHRGPVGARQSVLELPESGSRVL